MPSLLLLLAACVPCGTYEVSGTTADDADGAGYDGRWVERCGAGSGSFGQWNHFGDGFARITFWPDGPGDRGWQAVDFEIEVGIPTAALVPGATIGADELVGRALINPGITLAEDGAVLTSGSIEVRSGWEGDDPCAVEDGPTFDLRWDLTYGAAPGPLYELRGDDKVQFSNWLSVECGG